MGTGAVEIKSGYGLSVEDEMKMLRVAKRVAENTPLTVKTTLLGAHAVPARYKDNRSGYVDEIVNEMIPAVAAEGLAEFVDIFCEEGFFSVEDMMLFLWIIWNLQVSRSMMFLHRAIP